MFQHPLRIVPVIALAAVVAFPLSSAATGISELRGNDMIISVAKADTHFGPGLTYFAHGPAVVAVWSESGSLPPHTGGDYKWMFNAGTILHELGHSLSLDHGGPIVPASGPEILFVTSDNGRLYKLNALSGAVIGHVDVRRPTCPDDQITASPAVQLYAKSNAAFQGAMLAERGRPDDLVFVTTHHGCGDDDGNQVLAYYVSDLTLRWAFNGAGTYSMAAPSDGCEVDYSTNTIYCGTPQEQAGQHTLWAIETLQPTAQAARKWSYNAGSIQNRPMLGTGELFLVRTDAIIEDRDPATGSVVWTMATGSPVVRNLCLEVRPSLPTRFYYVTEDGQLHGTIQNFPNPVVLWPPVKPPAAGFSTMPAVAPALGKAYVGRDDGRLQQVSIDTGFLEGSVVAGTPGTLWDPALDYSGPNAADYDRLMITTTEGSDRRYCLVCGPTEAPLLRPVADLALAPGAPNPFSSRTRIGYRLPYDARVEIDVFAVDGRKVRTLVDRREAAGSHDASWDGLDDAGRSVEAGSYFYRMRAMGPSGQTLERSKKVQLVR